MGEKQEYDVYFGADARVIASSKSEAKRKAENGNWVDLDVTAVTDVVEFEGDSSA